MRFAAPVRAEIGIPTVFNILGPLANPARVRRYVIGIGDAAMAAKMVRVLAANGAERAWVVAGDGPIDEISLTGPTQVHTLDHRSSRVDPGDGGSVVRPRRRVGRR